mmetsp:Transcript_20800/g.48965  ORF Transcript_20800/g.48965 Transcript_20800/m.48965 type:complete len:267 (-) Transcript_20800:2097-2897(-)
MALNNESLGSRISHSLGLTQNKLHHRVLQGNWSSILRRLETPEGKKLARKPNPCGDLPLHLACYMGQSPPAIIRALIAAYPEGVHHRNKAGFVPLQLARVNYRSDHPFRNDVLFFLETYYVTDSDEAAIAARARLRRQQNDPDAQGADEQECVRPPVIVSRSLYKAAGSGSALELELEPPTTYQTSGTCVVCLDKKANYVILPCGHQCLCEGCAQALIAENHQEYHCPVGRCRISAIVKESALRSKKDRSKKDSKKGDGSTNELDA